MFNVMFETRSSFEKKRISGEYPGKQLNEFIISFSFSIRILSSYTNEHTVLFS